MVISVLDGSAVLEADLEMKVKRRLRALIRDEQQVTFYFYTNNEFIFCCEWVARVLQATYPQKKIECVGVAGTDEQGFRIPRARYTRRETLTGNNIWKWMVDQADYVICHMDLLMCSSRDRVRAYQYACTRKGEQCINLCSEWELRRVREEIGSLVRWEREALTGKMNGERKTDVAERLGVSKTTVRAYEVAAQRHLAEKIRIQTTPERRCAIFGFAAQHMSSETKAVLAETIRYLITCCGVTSFVISGRAPSVLTALLRQLTYPYIRPIRVEMMEKKNAKIGKVWQNRDEVYVYRGTAEHFAAQALEEKHAMIDISDIILCNLEYGYRSGLSYARRKRVPVINLSDSEGGP